MKFVEFTDSEDGSSTFVCADKVIAVYAARTLEVSCLVTGGDDYLSVRGTPSEVVAKLQGGPEVSDEAAMDEVIAVLERVPAWWDNDHTVDSGKDICREINRVLAKLKGEK